MPLGFRYVKLTAQATQTPETLRQSTCSEGSRALRLARWFFLHLAFAAFDF